MSSRKASDLFVECLEAEGVEYVFGIPGEETLDLNESLQDSSIAFVPVRHEQGGAYMADMYGRLTGRMVRMSALMLVLYTVIIGFGLNEFRKTPVGFIPGVDGGYLITVTQLPPASSLARTNEVNQRAVELALEVPGVAHAVNIVGFSGATRTNAPIAGAVFVVLKPFDERAKDPNQSAQAIQQALLAKFSTIQDAMVLVVAPTAWLLLRRPASSSSEPPAL